MEPPTVTPLATVMERALPDELMASVGEAGPFRFSVPRPEAVTAVLIATLLFKVKLNAPALMAAMPPEVQVMRAPFTPMVTVPLTVGPVTVRALPAIVPLTAMAPENVPAPVSSREPPFAD